MDQYEYWLTLYSDDHPNGVSVHAGVQATDEESGLKEIRRHYASHGWDFDPARIRIAKVV